jgi:predicted NAD/FAD-binding protein
MKVWFPQMMIVGGGRRAYAFDAGFVALVSHHATGAMYDTIIVGAGWSGAVAARILSKAGHRVLVLEARDRVGGRAHTFHTGGLHAPVDLGCSWIHGERYAVD